MSIFQIIMYSRLVWENNAEGLGRKLGISTTLKVGSFPGRNFRDFANFLVVRESLYPLNCSFQVVRESLYLRNFLKFFKN